MLQKVTVGRWSLDAYDAWCPEAIMAELREHARALQGARILQCQRDLLRRRGVRAAALAVPLLRDLGLEVDWKVIGGDQDFFRATKALHNALQGAPRSLDRRRAGRLHAPCTRRTRRRWTATTTSSSSTTPSRPGCCSVHGKGDARWVWRCHIDTSEPNPDAWSFLRPLLAGFDAAVFTMPEFVPPDFPVRARGDDRAGDRSAQPQEHRASTRLWPARSSTGSGWTSRDGW